MELSAFNIQHLTFNIQHSTFSLSRYATIVVAYGWTGGEAQAGRATELLQVGRASDARPARRHPPLLPLELSARQHGADCDPAVGDSEEAEAAAEARAGDRPDPRRRRIRSSAAR